MALDDYIIERREDGLLVLALVPIEIFGQQCDHPAHTGYSEPFGYGLMDAVTAWSDCNRAYGHMFRLDEASLHECRNPEDTIKILCTEEQAQKFLLFYGEPFENRPNRKIVPVDETEEQPQMIRVRDDVWTVEVATSTE